MGKTERPRTGEMIVYVIEDEIHAEQMGVFEEKAAALEELRRFATIPWDERPNVAPCTSWRTCGRNYELIEYEVDGGDWRELSRSSALEVDAQGVKWHGNSPGQ